MSENKQGIGQHRGSPGMVPNSGQKSSIRGGAADVGDASGGEHQNAVPGSRPINSGIPVHGAAENDYERAHNHGKK
jgi:hypothetical protein